MGGGAETGTYTRTAEQAYPGVTGAGTTSQAYGTGGVTGDPLAGTYLPCRFKASFAH